MIKDDKNSSKINEAGDRTQQFVFKRAHVLARNGLQDEREAVCRLSTALEGLAGEAKPNKDISCDVAETSNAKGESNA